MQAQALSHVNIGSVLSRIRFETPDSLKKKKTFLGTIYL
jgi:DNA mismatch repair protein MutH